MTKQPPYHTFHSPSASCMLHAFLDLDFDLASPFYPASDLIAPCHALLLYSVHQQYLLLFCSPAQSACMAHAWKITVSPPFLLTSAERVHGACLEDACNFGGCWPDPVMQIRPGIPASSCPSINRKGNKEFLLCLRSPYDRAAPCAWACHPRQKRQQPQRNLRLFSWRITKLAEVSVMLHGESIYFYAFCRFAGCRWRSGGSDLAIEGGWGGCLSQTFLCPTAALSSSRYTLTPLSSFSALYKEWFPNLPLGRGRRAGSPWKLYFLHVCRESRCPSRWSFPNQLCIIADPCAPLSRFDRKQSGSGRTGGTSMWQR